MVCCLLLCQHPQMCEVCAGINPAVAEDKLSYDSSFFLLFLQLKKAERLYSLPFPSLLSAPPQVIIYLFMFCIRYIADRLRQEHN